MVIWKKSYRLSFLEEWALFEKTFLMAYFEEYEKNLFQKMSFLKFLKGCFFEKEGVTLFNKKFAVEPFQKIFFSLKKIYVTA